MLLLIMQSLWSFSTRFSPNIIVVEDANVLISALIPYSLNYECIASKWNTETMLVINHSPVTLIYENDIPIIRFVIHVIVEILCL